MGLTQDERAKLDADGFVVLTGLVSVQELADIRRAVEGVLERAPARDPMWRPGGTLHVDLNDDPAFDPIRHSPRLRGAVTHLLGTGWQKMSLSLRAPRPGHGAQVLHGAATLRPEQRGAFVGERFMLATAIVALVEFTPESGATRVVPGSHRTWSMRVPTNPDAPFPRAVPVCCPAGSAIVFPEALVHSGTRNRSDQRRDSVQVACAP